MTTPTSARWVGVAYVDQKIEREINKERHADLRYNHGNSIGSLIKEALTGFYLGFQRYAHCEIIFPQKDSHTSGKILAYGVFSDAGVVSKERELSNPAYRCIFIQIDELEYTSALLFCTQQQGKEFHPNAMFWSPIWPVKELKNRWYCIAFVMAVLHRANILKTYPITGLDTDEIVELLKRHPRKIQAYTPAKLMNIKSETGLF